MRTGPFVLRAVGTAALALTACWPAPNQNPDRTSYNPSEHRITQATVADLAESWVAPVDAGRPGTPVLSTNTVHVVAGQDAYGFDSRTGARRWKTRIFFPEFPDLVLDVSPNVFVRNGEVMVSMGLSSTLGGTWETEHLDPATGAVLRQGDERLVVDSVREPNSAGNFPAYLSAEAENTLVVGGPGGGQARLYWGPGGVFDGTAIGPDAVYVSATSLVPPLLDPPGAPPGTIWDSFGLGVRAYPKAVVQACTTDEGAASVPTFTFACPTWVATLDDTRATAPVLNPGGPELYVTTQGGNLYALDRADGSVLWSAALGSAGGEPALAEGELYVPTASNGLQAFDASGCGAATCTPDWTTAEGGTPSVAGDVLYLSSGSTVRAYPADGCGAATCGPLWSADAGGTVGKVVVTGPSRPPPWVHAGHNADA